MKILSFWSSFFLPLRFGVDGDGAGGAGTVQTFTKAELDAQIAAAVTAAKTPFSGVDVDEYKKLKEEQVKRTEDTLKAKGQYEQLIANTVKEKDAALAKVQQDADEKIRDLGAMLERAEVDGKLLSAATALKALKPEQVAALLRSSIKFDPATGVSVVDGLGNQVLSKSGKALSLEEHVKTFLEANPHFLPAGPSGSGSQGSGSEGGSGAFKISRADAKDPNKYRIVRENALKAGGQVEIVG